MSEGGLFGSLLTDSDADRALLIVCRPRAERLLEIADQFDVAVDELQEIVAQLQQPTEPQGAPVPDD